MERTLLELAALHAAMKEIERQIKGKELPPGSYEVSDLNITIALPTGTSVSRDFGENGDGTKNVKATSNLYGYALWAAFIKRLAKFNQANVIRAMLIEALEESLVKKEEQDDEEANVEGELCKIDPELAESIEKLKEENLPKRKEKTNKLIKRPKDAIATLTVTKTLAKAS